MQRLMLQTANPLCRPPPTPPRQSVNVPSKHRRCSVTCNVLRESPSPRHYMTSPSHIRAVRSGEEEHAPPTLRAQPPERLQLQGGKKDSLQCFCNILKALEHLAFLSPSLSQTSLYPYLWSLPFLHGKILGGCKSILYQAHCMYKPRHYFLISPGFV